MIQVYITHENGVPLSSPKYLGIDENKILTIRQRGVYFDFEYGYTKDHRLKPFLWQTVDNLLNLVDLSEFTLSTVYEQGGDYELYIRTEAVVYAEDSLTILRGEEQPCEKVIYNYGEFEKEMLLVQQGSFMYEPELLTYIDDLTTPLSVAQKSRINTLIKSLKSGLSISNLSEAFDTMYILAGETEESSLRNLVKNANYATAVNSPVFTQYEGFTGDGVSASIDTNYNPSTQGVNYTQNSASLGFYSRTNINDSKVLIGAFDGVNFTQMYASDGSDKAQLNLNNGAITNTQTSTLGFNIGSRTGSSAGGRYLNKILQSTLIDASAPVVNFNLKILARGKVGSNDNFTSNQGAVAFFGKGFSQSEINVITDSIEAYMDANGKGVAS